MNAAAARSRLSFSGELISDSQISEATAAQSLDLIEIVRIHHEHIAAWLELRHCSRRRIDTEPSDRKVPALLCGIHIDCNINCRTRTLHEQREDYALRGRSPYRRTRLGLFAPSHQVPRMSSNAIQKIRWYLS